MAKDKIEPVEAQFMKEQFLDSSRYTALQKDVLSGLLEDGKLYSLSDVDRQLQDFLNREVQA
ncbi:hypothetical protein [Paenibacillus sp. GbtcB18]|uniref:hypothetical protein n=1 Tax=Paenibacillus sp. GbtcB18 TaxID=2824763 RepID=UPI001C30111B|nr:hypothetical protein [Paenibacillus sp. GbtcB18]